MISPPSTGDALVKSRYLIGANFAVRFLVQVMVTEIVSTSPAESPLHPVKRYPGWGIAVSSTVWFAGNFCVDGYASGIVLPIFTVPPFSGLT
jgi:hypothetical protein